MKIFLLFVLICSFMIDLSLQQECITALRPCNVNTKGCCSTFSCYTGICVPSIMIDAFDGKE